MQPPAIDRLAGWFRDWHLPLRRFLSVRRSVVPADIDDIAQEVFLRMLRYGRAGLVRNPQAYLFKIAANVAAEWSLQPGRRQPHDSDWLSTLAADAGSDSDNDLEVTDEQLGHALSALSVRAREVIRLHYSEAMTHQAIAERLGVTRRIVKRDLIRAYATMRESLYLEGIETPDARRRTSRE